MSTVSDQFAVKAESIPFCKLQPGDTILHRFSDKGRLRVVKVIRKTRLRLYIRYGTFDFQGKATRGAGMGSQEGRGELLLCTEENVAQYIEQCKNDEIEHHKQRRQQQQSEARRRAYVEGTCREIAGLVNNGLLDQARETFIQAVGKYELANW